MLQNRGIDTFDPEFVILCFTACPVGVFGEGCKYECGHCAGDDVCHHVSGYCLRGCKTDWYGRRCLYKGNG